MEGLICGTRTMRERSPASTTCVAWHFSGFSTGRITSRWSEPTRPGPTRGICKPPDPTRLDSTRPDPTRLDPIRPHPTRHDTTRHDTTRYDTTRPARFRTPPDPTGLDPRVFENLMTHPAGRLVSRDKPYTSILTLHKIWCVLYQVSFS